jgi:hypothetical protein
MGQRGAIHAKTSKSAIGSCRLGRAGVKVFNSSFVAHGLFILWMKPCSTENFCYGYETIILNEKIPFNQLLGGQRNELQLPSKRWVWRELMKNLAGQPTGVKLLTAVMGGCFPGGLLFMLAILTNTNVNLPYFAWFVLAGFGGIGGWLLGAKDWRSTDETAS